MTDQRNDGGPAFPLQTRAPGGQLNSPEPGMSLRDWFAGQALASLDEPPRVLIGEEETVRDFMRFARRAYHVADAMLKARGE